MSSRKFENYPILSWAIDKFETILEACRARRISYDDSINEYLRDSFDSGLNIQRIFTSSPFKLNLGGETEKARIKTTDKPTGVFNFSLASRSLYPVTEFYSKKLAEEHPDRFGGLGLESGIIPADMVDSIVVGDKRTYIFRDKLLNEEFFVEKRKKGETAIENGVPGAKLKYASKERKVYQYYNRKGGKVKYVEIYSLFYFTSLSGDFQYAVRHIPAIMVAEYLESIGIKVRFYMTRFVRPDQKDMTLKSNTNSGMELPMANKNPNPNRYSLLIQPIIVKEFQQDFDKGKALAVSSASVQNIYKACAYRTISTETFGTLDRDAIYGNPDWNQDEYWEGIERYRNKYQSYVKLGIFDSKEVLPESMIFFHDYSIKNYFSGFCAEIREVYRKPGGLLLEEVEVFLMPNVNRYFNWWMKTSANVIKHKINIINSSNLEKDIRLIETELLDSVQELYVISSQTTKQKEKKIYEETGENILIELNITKSTTRKLKVELYHYINVIVDEMITFAKGTYYPTPTEEVEKRIELKENIFETLKKFK